jgi:DNA-binding SARP family transcriptional activator
MWRLGLFSDFEASCDGARARGLEAKRVQELLSLLVLSHGQTLNRELLADQIWPDMDTRRSKKYLRQTIWQLQRAFEEAGQSSESLLTVETERIRLRACDDLWVDIHELEDAHCSALMVPTTEPLAPATRMKLANAVRLYRGPLLAGWFHDWCREPRERYAAMHLSMLMRLMDDAELSEDWQSGLHYGQMALRADQANEQAHVHLMRCHCQAGNRTAALRQYEACVAALRDELAVDPDSSTTRLYQQIRTEGTSSVQTRYCTDDLTMGDAFDSGNVHARLRGLSQSLQVLQGDVEACIRSIGSDMGA